MIILYQAFYVLCLQNIFFSDFLECWMPTCLSKFPNSRFAHATQSRKIWIQWKLWIPTETRLLRGQFMAAQIFFPHSIHLSLFFFLCGPPIVGSHILWSPSMIYISDINNVCYQFRILRNLRIDIKDRLEEYSQSIVINS